MRMYFFRKRGPFFRRILDLFPDQVQIRKARKSVQICSIFSIGLTSRRRIFNAENPEITEIKEMHSY